MSALVPEAPRPSTGGRILGNRPSHRVETATRGVLIAAGLAGLAFGAINLLGRPFDELISAAIWFAVPAVLSDLVLLPAVAAVGWVLTKKLPAWLRLPVQVALVMIGALTALAVPFLGKPGLRLDNPSLLDRNYMLGYLIYVDIIVVAAAGWAVSRRIMLQRRTSGPRSGS